MVEALLAAAVRRNPICCGCRGVPIPFPMSAGQPQEGTTLEERLNGIDLEMTTRTGGLVPWPEAIAGDEGYRAHGIGQPLLHLSVTPVIPSEQNDGCEARSVPFDQQHDRKRPLMVRLIGWLKESRAVFTRLEKTAMNYAGMIKMAFIQRCPQLLAS